MYLKPVGLKRENKGFSLNIFQIFCLPNVVPPFIRHASLPDLTLQDMGLVRGEHILHLLASACDFIVRWHIQS